jgi:hypothetical protein
MKEIFQVLRIQMRLATVGTSIVSKHCGRSSYYETFPLFNDLSLSRLLITNVNSTFFGYYTLWMWAILVTFRRPMLSPSSESSPPLIFENLFYIHRNSPTLHTWALRWRYVRNVGNISPHPHYVTLKNGIRMKGSGDVMEVRMYCRVVW